MLLVPAAFALPLCGTPDVMRVPMDLREAPARVGVGRQHRAVGKAVYGSTYATHLESENFTINDPDGAASEALLQSVADALETAWTRFHVEGDWRQPVSTDQYLLWVILDDSLGGTTGYTTEYTTEDFPDGYPVIFLNPDYAYDDAFWEALAIHEYMHAVQYALRDYDSGDLDETWYWEASAMWAEEQAVPENDAYAVHSRWYTTQPELNYASTTNSHAYGMFVLNAYVEEQLGGAHAMQDAWEAGEARQGDAWSDIMADTQGITVDALWTGFVRTMGANALAEASLYTPVAPRGTLMDGASGTLGLLGSDYWLVDTSATVTVMSGDVFLVTDTAEGAEVEASAGTVISVTARSNNAVYTLAVTADPGGDTAEDTAQDTDTAEDTAGDTAIPDDSAAVADTGGEKEAPGGCGCQSAEAPVGLLALLGALAIVRRRRALVALPMVVGCSDNELTRVTRVDSFSQAPSNQVDILWIVDDSSSMDEEQAALSGAATAFVGELEAADMDFHLGVVTTDMGAANPEAGALVGTPAVLTSDCAADGDRSDCTYATQFAERVLQGTDGDDQEKGLGAALAALSSPLVDTVNAGFRGEGVPLVLLVLSDENDCTDQGALGDQTAGTECYSQWASLVPAPDLAHQLQDMTGGDVTMSGIIGPEKQALCKTATPGLRYAHVIQILRGAEANICDADYTPVMTSLGLFASGIQDSFQLGMSADPETIEVEVDPEDAEPYTVDPDDLVGWSYVSEYAQIHFNGSSVPPRGAVIEVSYTVAGPLPADVATTVE